tara:strand:- start:7523 stop:8101 length:579 start_codon:yes stop_codon:yes gene_type:complete
MKPVFDFIVEPVGERYNNEVEVGNKKLVLNSEIFNHEFINRIGKVISVPIAFETEIKVGDIIIVHHNVFRRWHNVKGIEKNSRCFLSENRYLVSLDQIFAYKRKEWKALKGFCFVKPIKDKNKYTLDKEVKLKGVVAFDSDNFKKGDVVGFEPGSEYEFIVDNNKMYRVMKNFITIKYGHKGNEETYNPSWA